MDYKEFRNGLLSLSSLLSLFSLTFLFSTIVLKPYIALEPIDRDFIVLICILNIIFSVYIILEGIHLKDVFKLEDKNIIKFGKRLGIITMIYFPNLLLFFSLLFKEQNNLQLLMIYLLLIIKVLLLGIIFKEVYDLVLKNPSDRKFELEKNRKLYFE